jgi:hypothetical protein
MGNSVHADGKLPLKRHSRVTGDFTGDSNLQIGGPIKSAKTGPPAHRFKNLPLPEALR